MQSLHRSLSFSQGLGILVSALLGTGVFIVPELTVKQSGANALWGWGLLVFAIIPIAFAFARLGKRYPHAGGASHYVHSAFGATQGRIVGWVLLALVPVGLPAAMEMAGWFLTSLVALTPAELLVVKLALVAGMLWVNLRGVKLSGSLQTTIAFSVGGIVVLLSVLAWFDVIPPIPAEPTSFNWGQIGAAAGLAFWSFIGIETLAHLSTEFKNPERDFPLCLIIGVALVGLVYWMGSWVTLHYALGADYSGPAMVYLFDALIGGHGKLLIGLFGFLSCVATMNIYLAGSSRMLWSLGKDGATYPALGKVNRHGAPANAVFAMSIASVASLLVFSVLQVPLEELIRMANGMIVLVYLLTMLSAVRLFQGKDRVLPGLGVLVCLYLAYTLMSSLWCIAVVYTGIFIVLKLRKPKQTLMGAQA
ncbi:L-methionine/branched-chain amino acid transporter [Hahella sp. CR1]|uniref:L-methionine/branched-chain amino acid transporter n=1 Tax=Hahella sp. CR1 TaxID=2992807 RepID=UPI0024436EF2|nr:L-methionine/branched-chain amino acid transporter [Hahella sp. CR1]MDG9670770.1 L-methionine/branched-chain amino acid transporter [Hahella sp. CR1]